jgi:hypothetical protein
MFFLPPIRLLLEEYNQPLIEQIGLGRVENSLFVCDALSELTQCMGYRPSGAQDFMWTLFTIDLCDLAPFFLAEIVGARHMKNA